LKVSNSFYKVSLGLFFLTMLYSGFWQQRAGLIFFAFFLFILSLVLTLISQEKGLYFFFFTSPLIPIWLKVFNKFTVDDFIFTGVLLGGLIQKLIKKEKFKIIPLQYFLFLLGIFSLISLFKAALIYPVIAFFLRMLYYILLLSLILENLTSNPDKIEKFINLLFYSIIILCGLSLLFYYLYSFNIIKSLIWLEALPSYHPGADIIKCRIAGTFGADFITGFLELFYPLFFSLYLIKKERKYLILFLLITITIFLTYTRAGIIASFAGLVLTIFLSIQKQKLLLRYLLYIIILFILFIILIPGVKVRMQAIAKNDRIVLIKAAWEIIKLNPLTGTGSGWSNYKIYLKKIHTTANANAHNSFLRMWAENGFFAFCIFVSMSLYIIFEIKKSFASIISPVSSSIAAGLTGGLFAYLIQNFSNNLFFLPKITVFMLLNYALLYTLTKFNGEGKVPGGVSN